MWIRTWPQAPPPRRIFVSDEAEIQATKLPIHSADLATNWEGLQEFWGRRQSGEHGFVFVEWDVAFSQDDASIMNEYALEHPHEVCAAPYKKNGVYVHSHGNLPGEEWVEPEAQRCDHFALGLTYVPWTLLYEFMLARADVFDRRLHDWRMTDTNLSLFNYRVHGARTVALLWDMHPVHLGW